MHALRLVVRWSVHMRWPGGLMSCGLKWPVSYIYGRPSPGSAFWLLVYSLLPDPQTDLNGPVHILNNIRRD